MSSSMFAINCTPSQNTFVPNSIIDRLRLFTSNIDEVNEGDLYHLFIEIIYEIFGQGLSKGWALDKLKTKTFDQNYISRESDCVYRFLCSNGYIFKLCYKLISNSLLKFNLYFSDIPVEVKQKITKSFGRSYYSSRFLYNLDSNIPIGLHLNSFEYYVFHFVLYGLKLTSDNISNVNINPSEQSVYRLLCLDYLNYFLPLDNSASMVLPQLSFNVLSTITIPNQKQCIIPSKLLSFIKKDVTYNEFSNDKVESSSWILTSESTWRSELLAFFLADIWLNCNVPTIPSIELNKLIRCFIKHLHLYSMHAKHLPIDNLKLILTARHSTKIYQYLAYYMDNWPQDFSFRFLLENWLCYIQPWRYENTSNQQFSITETEMNDKWKLFIIRNLLCYTKLFYLAIKRFNCIDICSPRYSMMVFRIIKVFNHPFLLKLILDIEQMFISDKSQHKKWNVLLSECLIEAEGSLFKYELMFSEQHNREYKLFYSKLQKSLDHVNIELNQFQEEKLEKSPMLEFILTPRRNKMSDYTLVEWEDIRTNLKSSIILMEQIINVNVTTTPIIADLSTWSISNISSDNTTSLINTSYSINQSFERSTINLSSKVHEKEWEMDPDNLETLPYENHILVNFSKYLKNIVQLYWNSYILKFSTEDTILAGILRQTLIRPPMKIFSYITRNDGKRIRKPTIIPPIVSFRWMASYYTIIWILFLLALIWAFNSFRLWIGLFYILRIIYLCVKYLIGYAPPFKWDHIHKN